MKESRRMIDNFDSQLQQKLSKIAQTKSHKKLPAKQLQQWSHGKPRNEIDKNLNIMMRTNQNDQNMQLLEVVLNKNSQASDQSKSRSSFSAHSQSNNKINLNDRRAQNNKINTQNSNRTGTNKLFEKADQSELIKSISNNQVYNFIVRNCGTDCQQLELSYFLAKCLAEYSPRPELSQPQIKHIFLCLQQEVTTTNPNIVSINALQMAIKKSNSNSLQLYILQKILNSKYHVLIQDIKNKQKHRQKQYVDAVSKVDKNKQEIQAKDKDITQREKKIQQRDKEVIKKQKALALKQKQIAQKIRNAKKVLQQKAKSLSQAYMSELNTTFEKISNKINSYERNMKYRIQGLTQKTNEIHRLREFKVQQIKHQMIKQLEDKYDKQYQAKIKKLQNNISELTEKQQKASKTEHELEEQNNKLMKIINKLETKHQKEETRAKQLCEEISSRKCQIKELQYLLQKKQEQNDHLMHKLTQDVQNGQQGQVSSRFNDKNNKDAKMVKNKSKTSLSNRKQITKKGNNNQHIKQQLIQCYESILQVLNCVQQVLHIKINQKLYEIIMNNAIASIFHDMKCRNLINFLYQSTIKVLNVRFQIPFIFKQNGQSIQIIQEFKNINSVIFQKNDNSWKLIFLLYVGTDSDQSQLWLQKLFSLSQRQNIQSSMHQQATKSYQTNFITAMLIKFTKDIVDTQTLENKKLNNSCLNNFAILTDFAIEFKAIGQGKYAKLWEGPVGKSILVYYCQIVKIVTKNQKILSQNIECIEKISILVQRLAINYQTKLKMEYLRHLQRLQQCSSPSSLLYQNLSSIRQNYAVDN